MRKCFGFVLKSIFLFVFCFFSYLYLSDVIRPELLFHNQQPAFFKDWNFFSGYLGFSGGLTEYAAGFFSQTFALNGTGSLFLVFFLAALIFTTYYLFKDLKDHAVNIFVSLTPAIFLIALMSDYYFPFSIALSVLFALIFSALLRVFISNRAKTISFLVIVTPVLYFAAGSGALWIFALCSIFILFQHYGFTKKLVMILLPLLYLIILPLSAYNLFNIHWDRAFFSFIPELPLVLKYSSSPLLLAFAFFVPVVIFIFSLYTLFKKHYKRNSNPENSRISFFHKNWFKVSLSIIALYAVAYIFIFNKKSSTQKELVLTDYYNYNGRWNEAVGVIKSAKQYNVMLDYQYVKAIAGKGQLANEFFRYPKYIGSDVLFPDKHNTSSLAVFSSEFYYDIGFISESMHWAYEAKSVLPYNTRVIKQLVMTNLIMGNYPAANMFLEVLDKAFFCDEFVNHYQKLATDTMLILTDAEIMAKRKLMPKNILVPGEIIDRFKILIEADSSNLQAKEFLLLYYILNHRLGNFLEAYQQLKINYQTIPQPFEEALFILQIRSGNQMLKSYPISESTKNMMTEYTNIMKQNGDNKENAKSALHKAFRDRYMYYLFYDSPMVTQAALGTREVREYQN